MSWQKPRKATRSLRYQATRGVRTERRFAYLSTVDQLQIRAPARSNQVNPRGWLARRLGPLQGIPFTDCEKDLDGSNAANPCRTATVIGIVTQRPAADGSQPAEEAILNYKNG